MKKLLGLVTVALALVVLAACGNQNNLDGEYYWISENRNDLILTIKNGEGVLKSDGTYKVTVNENTETFEIQGFMNAVVEYQYKDGVLTADLTGSERDYYKKGTPAYEKALKENGHDK